MSPSTTPISTAMRERVVRSLAASVAVSIALQAIVFLALSWAYHFIAQLAIGALARANGGTAPAPAGIAAAVALLALDLFTALAVGFIASRRLLRRIVRTTPHPMKPPTRPIPWASLAAAGAIVIVSLLWHASDQRQLAAAWFGWTFEAVRDVAIVALFWTAAVRAAGPQLP